MKKQKLQALGALIAALYLGGPAFAQAVDYRYRVPIRGLKITSAPVPDLGIVQMSATSLDFGLQEVGQAPSLQVSLLNGKPTPVVISSVQVSGSPAFTVSSGCAGSTLSPGAECLNSVTFAPVTEGAHDGTLMVWTASEGTFQVQLTGYGIQAYPELGVFDVPATKRVSDPAFALTAPTSTSSGAWSFESSDPAVATISGNLVTLVGLGETTITATQEPSGSYSAASIAVSLTVGP